MSVPCGKEQVWSREATVQFIDLYRQHPCCSPCCATLSPVVLSAAACPGVPGLLCAPGCGKNPPPTVRPGNPAKQVRNIPSTGSARRATAPSVDTSLPASLCPVNGLWHTATSGSTVCCQICFLRLCCCLSVCMVSNCPSSGRAFKRDKRMKILVNFCMRDLDSIRHQTSKGILMLCLWFPWS